jgi:hypothetical protein
VLRRPVETTRVKQTSWFKGLMSVSDRYCCKSRKSNDAENFAKVNF